MVKELNYGLMVQAMKEIMNMVKDLEKANISGKKANIMKVSGRITSLMEEEHIYGQIKNNIQVSGHRERCMDWEY